MLALRPPIVIGDAVLIAIIPPGLLVIVYEIIVPLPPGGVNAIEAIVSETVLAVRLVGGPGTVVNDTVLDAADVPLLLVAVIANV